MLDRNPKQVSIEAASASKKRQTRVRGKLRTFVPSYTT